MGVYHFEATVLGARERSSAIFSRFRARREQSTFFFIMHRRLEES